MPKYEVTTEGGKYLVETEAPQAEQPQQPKSPELMDYVKRFGKGAYESIPFTKQLAQITGSPAEEIYGAMGRGATFPERMTEAAGGVVPDLIMSAPFMRGAGLIPKIPGIVKAGLGYGAYGATKAAVQGQPIGPSALSSAGSAALFHGAGKIGASVLPQFGGRLGSSLAGSAVGAATGGEEGMALGAGLGALYPSSPVETHKLAKSIVSYALKPSKITKQYGADPVEGIVKEGILGKNWNETAEKVQIRLNELVQERDRIKLDARNRDVRISYTKNKVFKPIEDLINVLNRDPVVHKTEIENIKSTIDSLSKNVNLNDMNIDSAYELRDRLNMMKPSGIFTKTSQSHISDALHKVYHNMVESINNSGVSTELKTVNKRMQNLISAEKAISDAKNRNSTVFGLLPMGVFTYGAMGGQPWLSALVAGRAVLKTPAVSTTLGKVLGKKYPKFPKNY